MKLKKMKVLFHLKYKIFFSFFNFVTDIVFMNYKQSDVHSDISDDSTTDED